MSSWSCSLCSKSFTRKGDLTRHNHLHTGYRPHTCSECGKTFAQYTGLKTHMNIHTRVKPYLCSMGSCQAAFSDPSSCARHRKETHRVLGGYQCPESRCKASIKRRSAFTAHLRKHGAKYAGVNIDDLYSPVPQAPVAFVPQITPPDVMNFATPQLMTFETQSPHPSSYPAENLSAFISDHSKDLDLQIATGGLHTFESRSSSLTPPSSLSPSTSPSPSPLEFRNDHALAYVNIGAANAGPYSNGYPVTVLSPVSQLLFTYGLDSHLSQQPIEWA